MFKTIRPHPLLAAYVDAYWVSGGVYASVHRILPDTCADIIFNISEDVIAAGNGGLQVMPGNAFVVGTMTTFRDTVVLPYTYLLGIRFHPGALAAFTGWPLQSITDDHACLTDISAGWQHLLEPLLLKARTVTEKINSLNNFLLQRLPARTINADKLQESIALIRHVHGAVDIKTLAMQAYMSTRNFERHFLQSVGVSPKTFTRIVRFLHLKQQLKVHPDKPLLSLALDNGFYDHAHLTREFKAFAGESPTGFIQR
ncbi:AraC family transcriptional regulator [Chitinophaga arvensicola]|uniref:AraC-type DNA-binding protein n=1 Tax=Chitinophaga arvensicola TaxID=29529 RepID=A0A1I0P4I1_9BACT|nr:helix-turn-helix domain-containing protein [Chitinophaga arvensicola]SEW08922.1 AraC-type DNA-binding protein [Chitinophaga arvensicola]